MARGTPVTPVNWDIIEQKRKEEGLKQSELSELVGKAPGYMSKYNSMKKGLPRHVIDVLAEVFAIPAEEIIAGESPAKKRPGRTEQFAIDVLIKEIGELRGRIVELEKKAEEPAIVAIPMDPKEMATRVLGELLEGGWCTKDDVLREFNRHHIPMQYINDAVHANGVTLATSGVADRARTFYIKEE